MDYFFFMLSVLMWANTGVFLMVAMRYKYKAVQHRRHAPPTKGGAPPSGPHGLPVMGQGQLSAEHHDSWGGHSGPAPLLANPAQASWGRGRA
jgi:hypothetical protein